MRQTERRQDQEYEGWGIPLGGRRGCLLSLAALASLAVAGLAIHGYGAERLAEVRETAERELGPADPAAYAPPPVAPDDNVAHRLDELGEELAAIPTGKEDVDILRLLHRDPETWNEAQRQRVGEFLLPRSAVLAGARGLVALPGSDFGIDRGEGHFSDGVNLRASQVARLLYLHAAWAAAGGDAPSAIPSLAALGRVAESFYAESSELHHSLAVRVEVDQLRALRTLLATAPPPAGELDALERTIPATDSWADLRRTAGFHVAHLGSRPPRVEADTPLHWRLWAMLAGDLVVAANLEPFLVTAEAGEVPFDVLQRRYLERREGWLPRGPLRSDWGGMGLSERTYTIVTGRRLARHALALARAAAGDGPYPARLDAASDLPLEEPMSGEALLYEVAADGSALLALPAAAAEGVAEGAGLRLIPLPTRWPLPPPAAPEG